MPKAYEILDHTADIGLLCRGDSLSDLFEAAAEGMFSLLVDPATVKVARTLNAEASASSIEDLLVQWLQELLFIFSTKHYILSQFSANIIETADNLFRVRGTCGGEKVDPGRHSIFTEIKTVTYHQLFVRQKEDGWEARIILDI